MILASLLLTGCASAYKPPLTGPTASLNVTIHNTLAAAELDIVPPGRSSVFGKQMIAHSDHMRSVVFTTVKIPADEKYLFMYLEFYSSQECRLSFHFVAKPDRLYDVYFGDTPPPPQHSVLGKIGHFLYPAVGGRCIAGIQQVMPDGSRQAIPIKY